MTTSTCNSCEFFFKTPNNARDFEKGKGDCVTSKQDEKGKYWLSRPVMEESLCCQSFKNKN